MKRTTWLYSLALLLLGSFGVNLEQLVQNGAVDSATPHNTEGNHRWYKSLTCTQYPRVSDAQATRKSYKGTRQRRVDTGFKSGDLNQRRYPHHVPTGLRKTSGSLFSTHIAPLAGLLFRKKTEPIVPSFLPPTNKPTASTTKAHSNMPKANTARPVAILNALFTFSRKFQLCAGTWAVPGPFG